MTTSDAQINQLRKTIKSLEFELAEKSRKCCFLKQKVKKLTNDFRVLIGEADDDDGSRIDNQDNSFHFTIHQEILTDRIRTESYRDALTKNSHMFRNGKILDVGCGIGLLAMFAAKSGCEKVIGVDQSLVINRATDIVRENNLEEVIVLKKGVLEELGAIGKVSAIVSEWMGYFLAFEGMLDAVIYARDHYLRPGGKILPNRCTVRIVGSGDTRRYVELVDYWTNVYGFRMSCMKAQVVREPSIECCNPAYLVTSVADIKSFDFYTVTADCVNFSSNFSLHVNRSGSLTAIVSYFDVFFDLDNPVRFGTGPNETPTYWKQTVFSLAEPLSVRKGDVLDGRMMVGRRTKETKGLTIAIQIKNTSQIYYL